MVFPYSWAGLRTLTVLVGVTGLMLLNLSCAQKGLVTEAYDEAFYQIPKLFDESSLQSNPTFIIYGDCRAGWRIQEKFLHKRNWYTWRMALFPFYEAYWLGNGVVGGINWLRHTPDFGGKERRMVRDAIYAEVQQPGVDFVINGGDMPTDGRYPSHWATFLSENLEEVPLASSIPILPVVGNHEQANDARHGSPNFQAVFGQPPFYTLDFPDVTLVVVDSNIILDQYGFIDNAVQDRLFQEWFVAEPEAAEQSWLEQQLASSNRTFKIVVIHHPPISFGKHYGDWDRNAWGNQLRDKQMQLLQLFADQGVQLVLCSHEHFYEHNIVQMPRSDSQGVAEIHFVVTGGGGVPLRDIRDAEALDALRQRFRNQGVEVSVKQQRIHHYCRVSISPDEMVIEIKDASRGAEQPARIADTITIAKHSQ